MVSSRDGEHGNESQPKQVDMPDKKSGLKDILTAWKNQLK